MKPMALFGLLDNSHRKMAEYLLGLQKHLWFLIGAHVAHVHPLSSLTWPHTSHVRIWEILDSKRPLVHTQIYWIFREKTQRNRHLRAERPRGSRWLTTLIKILLYIFTSPYNIKIISLKPQYKPLRSPLLIPLKSPRPVSIIPAEPYTIGIIPI